MNFNVDGVDIALQVDLSQNASLNHQDGIQLVHWFQEQAIYNLCVDSQGCRRWVPVSKTAIDVIVSDQKKLRFMYRYTSMKTVCADLKASSLSFLLENICSSSNASCSQTSICGSKNISDANLESFSYRTYGNGVEGTEYGTRCSKLHRACLSPVVLL